MAKVKSNADLLSTPKSNNRSFDTEAFFARNRNLFLIVPVLLVVGVLAYFGYNYYTAQQEQEVQKEMYPAVYYAEGDSTRLALKGNKNYLGFETIIKKYAGTKGANLAHFYAGAAYMKEGKFAKAIEELKQFNAGDYLVQARAYCLIGDAYLELKKLEDAVGYYERAANYQPNEFFTPVYLSKLALVYELQGAKEKGKGKEAKYKNAIEMYDKIIRSYPTSQEVTNAKKYKGRLESMMMAK